MKELNISNIDLTSKKDNTELSVQQKQQVEREFIGSIKPKNGHIVFEINVLTLEIVPAKFDELAILKFTSEKLKRTITINKDCVYISALNKENALKKFRKVIEKHAKNEI